MKFSKNKTSSFLMVFLVVLSFLIFLPQALVSQNQFPKPVGHVNDFADVISENTGCQIEAICIEVKQKTGAEIAILTVQTIGDQHDTDYTIRLLEDENWQLGERGKDNGVLIFKLFRREN
ncbi:TPM domain-containing protein [candidate division KSB1 bacterium]|nr:TPM domain-containing protein [candidate division KSB1 bacterium]TDJ02337.1 MAG: TPM domain-containing protein [Caldithrix sp.]